MDYKNDCGCGHPQDEHMSLVSPPITECTWGQCICRAFDPYPTNKQICHGYALRKLSDDELADVLKQRGLPATVLTPTEFDVRP